jgi:3-methyl-2-oxobutanoate hydroxymethyltransferase
MSLTSFPGGGSPRRPATSHHKSHHARAQRDEAPGQAHLRAHRLRLLSLAPGDEAGIDLLLVGDSLAMVVLGHENTLAVTVDEMLHHTRAVRRAVRRALVVPTCPSAAITARSPRAWPTPSASSRRPAPRRSRSKARASSWSAPSPRPRFPSVGHLGLTPQSVHRMGGYRVQARTAETVLQLKADALALAEPEPARSCSKAFPAKPPRDHRRAAHSHHRHRRRPGLRRPDSRLPRSAQPHLRAPAKFVRRYADAGALIRTAIEHYREDVEHRAFPSDEESYHLPEAARRLSMSPQPMQLRMPVNRAEAKPDGNPSHRSRTPPVVPLKSATTAATPSASCPPWARSTPATPR